MSSVPAAVHIIDEASFQHDANAPINYENVVRFLASEAIGGADPTTYGEPVIVGIIIKVSEGDNYYNPYAQIDAEGFASVRIPNVMVKISYYAFIHTTPSVDAQLNWALNHIKLGQAIIWIDSEAGGIDQGQTWADLDRVTGLLLARSQVIGAYTNEEGIKSMPSINASPKPIWFADPSNVAPGQRRSITQSGQGTVTGITGAVDEDNASYATAAALPWSYSSVYEPPSVINTPVDPAPAATPTVTDVAPSQPATTSSTSANPTEPVAATTSTPEPAVPAPEVVPTTQGVDVSQLPLLKKGDSGPFVKRLQGLLVAAGHNLGTTGPRGDGVDGGFGDITLREVLLFQHQSNISIDGVVGPVTWATLLGI